jgi:hypothetical protein
MHQVVFFRTEKIFRSLLTAFLERPGKGPADA